ncbi:MAG TPA: hypothetical protein DER33_09510 [Syntrophomonas sp.]|jgi:hypothetical protein|nr:hypothetical protein [Syntrophomonas sp.]HCF71801.1 hypothetical protein [Syntrophomonas sp.]
MLRKKIFFVLVLAFLMSCCTYGPVGAANTSPFQDVNDSHWAMRHIVKMNLRGVVAGYTNGTFQPDKQVTQLEAVLMAVHNMTTPSQIALVNDNRTLPVSVPAWAEQSCKKELLYAVDQGLIKTAESNFYAGAYASRAWMAQLMVRMIGKDAEATELSANKTTFTDDSSIPIWALGYVNAAVKYNIVAGYPDNTFKPLHNVTRAEAVSLLSSSEQHLNISGNLIIGSITGINNSLYTITAANGSVTTLTLNNQTWVFDQDGKLSNYTILKNGDAVKCITNGTNVSYIEVQTGAVSTLPVLKTVNGTISYVIPEENVLVVKQDDNSMLTYKTSATTNIVTDQGEALLLSKLQSGYDVQISLDAQNQVVRITVLNAQGQIRDSGIIYDLVPEQKLIILKDSLGNYSSFQYSDYVLVKIEGVRFPVMEDLRRGDEVKIRTNKNIVEEIELLNAQQDMNVSGKIVLLSETKNLITLEKDNNISTYYLASNPTISISGLTNARFSDLSVDDEVECEVTSGKISSIKVKNRSLDDKLYGTVVAVDTKEKIVVLRTDDKEVKTLEVSSVAQFCINGSDRASLSDLERDMEIEVELLNGKIIYAESGIGLGGTLVSINEDRNLIAVERSGGQSQTYFVSEKVKINMEDTRYPDLSDLRRNDYVELKVENDVVTQIDVRRSYVCEVTDVSKSSERLEVENADGDDKYLYLDSRVELVVPGVSYPRINDISEGDFVKVTYLGTELERIEVIESTGAIVTNVNTSSRKVTVRHFDGTVKTYSFDSNCTVIKGGSRSSRIGDLAVDDRVIIAGEDGASLSFTLLSKITGTYQSKDSSNSVVYINRSSTVKYVSWELSDNCYIHRGTQTLTLNTLQFNNYLTLYTLGEKVYEIEVN